MDTLEDLRERQIDSTRQNERERRKDDDAKIFTFIFSIGEIANQPR